MKHLLVLLAAAVLSIPSFADEPIKHQITGLFSPDRQADLRETFAKIPQIKLLDIDFKTAEVTLEYNPTVVFPKAKPSEVIEKLDNLVKSASNHTFGVKPLSSVPRDQLKVIEIEVMPLDCKACGLAAYEIVSKVAGVETTTVSFREGRITAWIDPTKTDRAALVDALKRREVVFPTK
jgi:copper chaperone CopZ